MSPRFTPASSNALILFLLVCLLPAAAMSAAAAAEELLTRSPERGGIGLHLQQLQFDKTFINSFRGRRIREGLLNRLDERLSIIVTDKASTSAITFRDVMAQLAVDMHVRELTLFQRWWDTANTSPGISGSPTNVFCNSWTKNEVGLSLINGFPYGCPRKQEGMQAALNPFENEADGYTAIAFVNRFDLADTHSGRHCGEFRIVFARNSGFTDRDNRNLIIFEALVPNPSPPDPRVEPTPDKPFANLKGCRPIVEFWLSLSDPGMNTKDRGTALKDFFLKGLPNDNVGRIVDTRHYAGGPDSGQIRTNQFMGGRWNLREFKTYGGSIVPATVKSNPGNKLFSSFADPRKGEFEDYLVTQDALDNIRGIRGQNDAARERNVFTFGFGLTTAGLDHLNSFDSMPRAPELGDVVKAYEKCNEPCPLKKRIEDALHDAGSNLDANTIVHRIRTQTCAGCHHYSNGDKELGVECPEGWLEHGLCVGEGRSRRGIWPGTLGGKPGFTHVSENEHECGTNEEAFDLADLDEITPDTLRGIRSKTISRLNYMGPDAICGPTQACEDCPRTRYRISDTLKFVLMPPRFETMVLYLNSFDPP